MNLPLLPPKHAKAAASPSTWRSDRALAGVAKNAQNLSPYALRRRVQPALELALAPVPHHLRQRDLIGQTLSQRPQKVEALGRCPALSTPISDGVSTAPIGPG